MAHADLETDFTTSKKDFHHPYTPYPIQETFMQTVYDVIEQGNIGILESPTGTGKSLSLICGALTWLRERKAAEWKGMVDGDEDEPEWIREAMRERRKKQMLKKREEVEGRLRRVREKERKERDRMNGVGREAKRRKLGADADGGDVNEEDFLLDDWDSDAEGGVKDKNGDESVFSKETLKLMEAVGMTTKKAEEDDEDQEDEMKIFYCSRTHSQLTQFINELRRLKFPPSIQQLDLPNNIDTDTTNLHEDIKHITLGSRKNLCINPKVNKLTSSTAINERCAELQQSSTPQSQRCPFLPTKDNKPLVHDFRDHSLATIRDIEDMGTLGKELSICPYYASRSAIKPAEIITLPYPLLLQKSAREALGISLKGHVVIIDEAHNLMDAISGIYGTEISLRELKSGREMLGMYLKRFARKLAGKNRVYVAQVVRVVDSLVGYLEGKLGEKAMDGVVDEKELLAGKGVDQINLFKLIRYLQESKLARKIESYATHTQTQTEAQATNSKNKPSTSMPKATTPTLHTITSLLHSLTHPTSEGRLFFTKTPPTTTQPTPTSTTTITITLKFQLLDPSPHLLPLATLPRALLLAGGTMSPFSDYTSHLFPTIPSSKIVTLSCGHVVPSSSIFAATVTSGPTNIPFRFDYSNRDNTAMQDELGRVLLNICAVVPDGVVVFFSSYAVLMGILRRWMLVQPGVKGGSIYERLAMKKGIFREEKERKVEEILEEYAKSIRDGKGGLLFSVVGGKLSEGINFSDGLGRCVVIVGLPFPNARTAEWQARLRWVEEGAVGRLRGGVASAFGNGIEKMGEQEILKKAKEESKEYFENICMRAVNQSVGRAIRHKGDWAGIIMVDERFRGERVRGKLSGWIRGCVREEGEGKKGEGSFGKMLGGLGVFSRVKEVKEGV